MEFITENKILMCCRKGSNCPTIEKIENDFVIQDDYNGKVVIKKHELSQLKEAIKHFEKNV